MDAHNRRPVETGFVTGARSSRTNSASASAGILRLVPIRTEASSPVPISFIDLRAADRQQLSRLLRLQQQLVNGHGPPAPWDRLAPSDRATLSAECQPSTNDPVISVSSSTQVRVALIPRSDPTSLGFDLWNLALAVQLEGC